MLKINNISKSFNNKSVLKNISIQVQKGEIVSLLGQSGSGKSTLLNIIAGFEEVDSGLGIYDSTVIFDEKTFCEPQDRHIGFVFQNYALFPHLTIEKNITFGIDKKDAVFKDTKVKELLKLIKMEGYEKKYPHEISGGQQQRIAIARVLARESDLILFDETFSSIDSILKQELMIEIKDIIKSYNKTAIFVTHSPQEAKFLSDKIAYIENGSILQYDSLLNIQNNPKSETIKELFI